MSVYEILEKVRNNKPLVYHITNYVTIYDCANITRAFGALPVMAFADEEAEEMAGIASSLVLNIGTLTKEIIGTMLIAGKKANEIGIPVILDAVGAGATRLRTDKVIELLDKLEIAVVKGNISELATLAGVKAETKGVEAVSAEGNAAEIAKAVANKFNVIAVITGRTDIVASKDETYSVDNGHELMGSVVGTGCMSASVIGSFCAVHNNYAEASAAALAAFGIAGELAAEKSRGPGSFKENFYDEVFNLDNDKLSKANIE